jgi:uncharacterized protein YigE (DUF2233 family)
MIRWLPALFACALPALATPEKKAVDGVTYHILHAKPAQVRVIWKDAKGSQLETFPQATAYLASLGDTPDTIMNGASTKPVAFPAACSFKTAANSTRSIVATARATSSSSPTASSSSATRVPR